MRASARIASSCPFHGVIWPTSTSARSSGLSASRARAARRSIRSGFRCARSNGLSITASRGATRSGSNAPATCREIAITAAQRAASERCSRRVSSDGGRQSRTCRTSGRRSARATGSAISPARIELACTTSTRSVRAVLRTLAAATAIAPSAIGVWTGCSLRLPAHSAIATTSWPCRAACSCNGPAGHARRVSTSGATASSRLSSERSAPPTRPVWLTYRTLTRAPPSRSGVAPRAQRSSATRTHARARSRRLPSWRHSGGRSEAG